MFSAQDQEIIAPAPYALPKMLEVDPKQFDLPEEKEPLLLDTTSFVLYAGGTRIALPETKSSSIQLKNGGEIIKLEDGKIAISINKKENVFDIFDPFTQDSAAGIRVFLPYFSSSDWGTPLQWEIHALQGNGICFLAANWSAYSHCQAVFLHKGTDDKYRVMCKSTDLPSTAREIRYNTACVTSDGSTILIASDNESEFLIGNVTFRTVYTSKLKSLLMLPNGLICTDNAFYNSNGIIVIFISRRLMPFRCLPYSFPYKRKEDKHEVCGLFTINKNQSHYSIETHEDKNAWQAKSVDTPIETSFQVEPIPNTTVVMSVSPLKFQFFDFHRNDSYDVEMPLNTADTWFSLSSDNFVTIKSTSSKYKLAFITELMQPTLKAFGYTPLLKMVLEYLEEGRYYVEKVEEDIIAAPEEKSVISFNTYKSMLIQQKEKEEKEKAVAVIPVAASPAVAELSQLAPPAEEKPSEPAPPAEEFSIEEEENGSQSTCCFSLRHCLFGKKTTQQASLNRPLLHPASR